MLNFVNNMTPPQMFIWVLFLISFGCLLGTAAVHVHVLVRRAKRKKEGK